MPWVWTFFRIRSSSNCSMRRAAIFFSHRCELIFNFSLFYAIFLIILIASAFWMPLTNLYVGNPSTGMWIGIRTVLILVGLASIALLWALLSLQGKVPGVSYWLAVVGSGYFAFHTVILDAIIWAALFKQV